MSQCSSHRVIHNTAAFLLFRIEHGGCLFYHCTDSCHQMNHKCRFSVRRNCHSRGTDGGGGGEGLSALNIEFFFYKVIGIKRVPAVKQGNTRLEVNV
jgi:hypothetical protein